MKDIEIRKIRDDDIPEVVDIWYEASIEAHSFISNDYWEANKTLMQTKYIPMSEAYLATNGQAILGFVALIDEYLAAIFVRPKSQGKGIGGLLLNYIKNLRRNIQLKVYCKNKKSIEFYKARDFSVISESKDEETGESEFVMEWHK